MVNYDLQNYITQSRASGMMDAQIRQNLVAQGWKQDDIEEGFGYPNLNAGKVMSQTSSGRRPRGIWISTIILSASYLFLEFISSYALLLAPEIGLFGFVNFFLPIIYIPLGLAELTREWRKKKESSSLPVELFYWIFGFSTLLYGTINGISFSFYKYIYLYLGAVIISALIFWILIRPIHKKRAVIFGLICVGILSWYFIRTAVTPIKNQVSLSSMVSPKTVQEIQNDFYATMDKLLNMDSVSRGNFETILGIQVKQGGIPSDFYSKHPWIKAMGFDPLHFSINEDKLKLGKNEIENKFNCTFFHTIYQYDICQLEKSQFTIQFNFFAPDKVNLGTVEFRNPDTKPIN